MPSAVPAPPPSPPPPPEPWTAIDDAVDEPLVAPRVPVRETPRPFPLLATLAPVIGSVAIWLITSSPFALVFAALGPLIAVASVGDTVVGGRRRHRRARARFLVDLARLESRILERHALERAALDRRFPSGSRLSERGVLGDDHSSGPVLVRLGLGTVRSRTRIDAEDRRRPDPAVDEDMLDLLTAQLTHSARLDDAPIVVDARGGIGLCGPATVTLPLARACAVQLAASSIMTGVELSVPPGRAWEWLRAVAGIRTVRRRRADEERACPTGAVDPGEPGATLTFSSPTGPVSLSLAPSRDGLPASVRSVVVIDSSSASLSSPDRPGMVEFRPDLLSEEEASAAAIELVTRLSTSQASVQQEAPESVSLGELLAHEGAAPRQRSRGSLLAPLGRDARGVVEVDLVRDGPHAVIGGTTGSGKSELLVTWILTMAARYPPTQVTFLLVDFKGGATMESLALLPHTVGVVTDLDRVGALRAVSSLGAELRRRERLLAESACRSLDDLPAGAQESRLVIVVDEFAALVADSPELSAVFSDLAARGRSLGIHLLLCTQRPSGVVTEAVLANCTLRISLRVATTTDSVTLLGSPDAASLPRIPAGRALISIAGETPLVVQIARAHPRDHAAAEARWPSVPLHRPWCPPLPRVIPLADLPAQASPVDSAGIAFAIADLPDLQAQPPEVWTPAREGSLLVLGRAGSGRSSALRAISHAAEAWSITSTPADPAGAWDVVLGASGQGDTNVEDHPAAGRLVVIDDLDALLARFSDDHRAAFTEALVRLVRDGPQHGLHVAASTRRITPALQQVAAVVDSRVLLGMPSRHEHVVAGGSSDDFVADLTPGAGYRDGRRVQIAWVVPEPAERGRREAQPTSVPRYRPRSGGTITALITIAPDRMAAVLRAQTGVRAIPLAEVDPTIIGSLLAAVTPVIVVGAPEEWQSTWTLLAALRPRADLLVHGCGVAEFRALTGSRVLPPPLSDRTKDAWCLSPGGEITRVRP